MELLKNMPIYVISDVGWYYNKVLGVYFSEKDAIEHWENLTDKKWDEANYTAYVSNSITEKEQAHYYFAFEKILICVPTVLQSDWMPSNFCH